LRGNRKKPQHVLVRILEALIFCKVDSFAAGSRGGGKKIRTRPSERQAAKMQKGEKVDMYLFRGGSPSNFKYRTGESTKYASDGRRNETGREGKANPRNVSSIWGEKVELLQKPDLPDNGRDTRGPMNKRKEIQGNVTRPKRRRARETNRQERKRNEVGARENVPFIHLKKPIKEDGGKMGAEKKVTK